jgi:ankyrin repeat protein
LTPDWAQALRNGDLDALTRQLGEGADIDARDGYGQTGLMLAAAWGHVSTVRWLVEQGADLDHHAKYGLSATMLAVARGHPDVVGILVAAGADLTLRGTGTPGFARLTALDLAKSRSDVETVAMLEAAPSKQRE